MWILELQCEYRIRICYERDFVSVILAELHKEGEWWIPAVHSPQGSYMWPVKYLHVAI